MLRPNTLLSHENSSKEYHDMISKEDSIVIHRESDDQFQYESRFDEYTDVLNQDISEHTEV